MKSRKGFTLIEMIIFVAIFSVAMAAFTLVFTNVAKVQVSQSDQAEVHSQSQFLLQKIQYYVERSSLVDMPTDTATTTLKLRMASSTEDPVIITLVNGALQLKVGGGATQTITSSKVSISDLSFIARSNPGGHTSVAVAFTVNYATENLTRKFAKSLKTAVSRVAAATFDSDIVPSTGNTYQLGASAGDWRSINNTLYFSGSNVGIGTGSPGAPLEVDGGDIYINSSIYGLLLKATDAPTHCFRISVDGGANITATEDTCP